MAKDVNGNEIKVGMKVKRINGMEYCGCKLGGEYTVEYSSSDNLVKLKNCTGGYTGDHFEIVLETQKAETGQYRIGKWYKNINPGGSKVINKLELNEPIECMELNARECSRGRCLHCSGYTKFRTKSGETFYECGHYNDEIMPLADAPKPAPAPHAFKVGDRVHLISEPENLYGMGDDYFTKDMELEVMSFFGDEIRCQDRTGIVCGVTKNQIEKLPDDKPSEPEYKPVNIPGMNEWAGIGIFEPGDYWHKPENQPTKSEPYLVHNDPKKVWTPYKPEPQSLAVKSLYF